MMILLLVIAVFTFLRCDSEYYCHGLRYNESNVCSGHGTCRNTTETPSKGYCECQPNYFGDFCNTTSCYNIMTNSTDENTCGYFGECVEYDHCLCHTGYYGVICNITMCYGTFSNVTEICSGRGVCEGPNECVCNHLKWAGDNCDEEVDYFITFDFYEQPDCSDDGLGFRWVLTPDASCTNKPFLEHVPNHYAYYHWDDKELKYVGLSIWEPLGITPGENCEMPAIHGLVWLDVGKCGTATIFGKSFYVYTNISRTQPFKSYSSTPWLAYVQQNYWDGQCDQQVDDFRANSEAKDLEPSSIIYSFLMRKYRKYVYPTDYYCNDDDFIFRYESGVVYKIIKRSDYDNKCFSNFDRTYFVPQSEYIHSVKLRCLTVDEFYDNFDPLVPSSSNNKGYRSTFSFASSICNRSSTEHIRGVDIVQSNDPVCHGNYLKYRYMNSSYAEIRTKSSDCEGIWDRIKLLVSLSRNESHNIQTLPMIDPSRGLSWTECRFDRYDTAMAENIYQTTEFETGIGSPLLGDYVASIDTHLSCNNEIDMRVPANLTISFFGIEMNKDLCIMTSMGMIGNLYKCVNGELQKSSFISMGGKPCTGMSYLPPAIIDGECSGYSSPYQHINCVKMFCGKYNKYDTAKVCSAMGSCIGPDLCLCHSGYVGTECQDIGCYEVPYYSPFVCSGHGKCTDPNICVCVDDYSGDECQNPPQKNDNSKLIEDYEKSRQNAIIVSLSAGIPSLIFIITIICCLCCCCLCCCIYCLICNGCLIFIVSGVGFSGLRQNKRLKHFMKLEDFDVILHEQLIEKRESSDSNKAHLEINKSLFEIPFDEVKIQKSIGSGGSNSVVYLSRWNGQVVAFKCFRTRMICSSQDNFNEFEREVNLLININHPNIIRFFGASLKPPRVGIVMEYCSYGEILHFLIGYRNENGQKRYPIHQVFRMLKEIISAVKYIHSRNIVHRDIKSENILVSHDETCKLMDFGLSRIVQEQEKNVLKTQAIGTSVYMAPELLTGYYDSKVDSFAFSILLWVVICEQDQPYGEHTGAGVELRVANDPKFRPDLDKLGMAYREGQEFDWVREVMERNWDEDAQKRNSFEELYQIFEEKSPKESDDVDMMEEISEIDDTNNEIIGREKSSNVTIGVDLIMEEIDDDDDDSDEDQSLL